MHSRRKYSWFDNEASRARRKGSKEEEAEETEELK